MNIHIILFSLLLIFSPNVINAEDFTTFVIDGFPITVNNSIVSDISLNWSPVHNLPEGTITLSETYDGIIEISVPKSMPRTMNLDFGTELVVEGHGIKSGDISETESECFYNIQFHFKNSDYLEFGTMSLAAGRWEPVSVLNQSCGEFSLRQQIENNMPVSEIKCKNDKHVLAERPNGKLACIYHETSEKLNWPIINADTNRILSVYELPVNDALYDIEYTVKGGIITNMMQNDDNNSLLITIDSNKDGEITLHIPHGVIDPIPKDSGDNWLIVLVNGEEVQSEQDVDDKLNRTVSLKFNHPDPEIELIASYWI